MKLHDEEGVCGRYAGGAGTDLFRYEIQRRPPGIKIKYQVLLGLTSCISVDPVIVLDNRCASLLSSELRGAGGGRLVQSRVS